MVSKPRRLTVICGLDIARATAVAYDIAAASPHIVHVEPSSDTEVGTIESAARSGYIGGASHTVVVVPWDSSGMHVSHVLSEAAAQLGETDDDYVIANALVVVVNVATFFEVLADAESGADQRTRLHADDDRTVPEILIEQIESADVILLDAGYRTELVEANRVRSIAIALNPSAHVETCVVCAFDSLGVLEHARPAMASARRPAWLAHLDGELAVLPIDDVSIFVWRSRRPLHGQRFHDLIDAAWPGVVRVRGFFWLASRPEMIGLLDIAGSSVAVEPSGWWWAACPPGEWPADPAERRRIENSWDIDFGDRMNELVIVGYGLNEANVQRALDACLVGELETTNPDGADDPFGEWDDGLDDGIRMPDHDGPPWPVMFN